MLQIHEYGLIIIENERNMQEKLKEMGFSQEEIVMILDNPVTAILLKVTELPMEKQIALKETLLNR